jgi:Type IX secretion system protein PorV
LTALEGVDIILSGINPGVHPVLKKPGLRPSSDLKTFFLVFLSPLVLLTVSPAWAGGPGSSGAVELKIPEGPRAIAMGQAFVAVADDASAVYWNPAGLNQLGGAEISASYDVFIDTVRYDYGSVAFKLNNDFAMGLGVKYLTTGTDPAVDSAGITTGGTVGETYMDIDLAVAYRLSYYFNVGITAKYINKTLAGTGASGFAADLGVLYFTPIPHLTAGMNLQNIGPGLKFDQVADPLPFNVKLGIAYKMFNDDFTVAYDMNFPSDNAISANLGGEYWYKNTLVGRFGYQFQGSIDQNQVGIGGEAGLFLGAGVKIAAFKNYIGLDYAWTNDGFLGSNHHFALDFYF